MKLGLCSFVAAVCCTRVNAFSSSPISVRRDGLQVICSSSSPLLSDAASSEIPRTSEEPRSRTIYRLSQQAMETEGDKRYSALKLLGRLCAERHPYIFDKDPTADSDDGLVQKIPFRLSRAKTDRITGFVQQMLRNGWMSTNPDSVDSLPSFHVNIVSNGTVLFPPDEDDNPFEACIGSIYSEIQPFLEKTLEPYVQERVNPDLEIADVFLRRYSSAERTHLSAHYDVTSYATVVLTLDGAAADGRNGLFTCRGGSNHAALREYFSLERGQGVLHTWNVLHGVDVESHVERTSLIVWFSTRKEMSRSDPEGPPHWLMTTGQPVVSKGIHEFVLASATESISSTIRPPVDLYLASAAQGNSFAYMRLGTLCEEGAITDAELEHARALLQDLWSRYDGSKRWKQAFVDTKSEKGLDGQVPRMSFAEQFWYFAALQGNAMAQMALADQLMSECASSSSDRRFLAATLFVLAAQQGYPAAEDLAYRCVEWEADLAQSKEEFLQSPLLAIVSVLGDTSVLSETG